MANKTALDFAINLEARATSQIAPIERTKNLCYFVLPKTGITDEYVLITDKADLATYLDGPNLIYAGYKFDEGLGKLYLAFKNNITDLGKVSPFCYMVLMATGTDPQPSEISGFDGVKVWIKSDATDPANETLAKTEKNCVVICDLEDGGVPGAETGEGFASVLCARFLVQIDNFSSLQYDQFTYTPKLTTNSEWDAARDAQLTFLIKDQTTVVVSSLGYFRSGGKTIAEPFIQEALRQDLQTAAYNYILNNKPPYTNPEIGAIALVCQKIVDDYAERQLINTAGTVVIPPRQEQTSNDIIVGKVDDFTLNYEEASAIWWIGGTIKAEVN